MKLIYRTYLKRRAGWEAQYEQIKLCKGKDYSRPYKKTCLQTSFFRKKRKNAAGTRILFVHLSTGNLGWIVTKAW